MIAHFILISSSWSEGTRICLHFTGDCAEEYSRAVEKVRKAYDGKVVPLSSHMLHTDSVSWQSVCDEDHYFRGIKVISSAEEFVNLIRRDRFLKGLDIARYILSKTQCTHTRLEKLTYFCYADYLCRTGSKLFTDKIYAFERGPVVETVYEKYNECGKLRPGILVSTTETAPMRCRIQFAEDGLEKRFSIDGTLELDLDSLILQNREKPQI